ncbi:MAG: thioredoxin family protein [Planctomycetaceae bacterium]|nr:thioredoxin family protein [Planctomycetaceae bacterium]
MKYLLIILFYFWCVDCSAQWDMFAPVQQDDGTEASSNRMLMFTSKTCPPCREWKTTVAPRMRESNWLIGDEETNHIQFIDCDTRQDLVTKYGVSSIPLFVMIDPIGREVARSGYMDEHETAAFYKKHQAGKAGQEQSLHGDDHENKVDWAYVNGKKQRPLIIPQSQPARVTRRKRFMFRGCPTCPY